MRRFGTLRLILCALLLAAPLACGSNDDDGGGSGGSNVANPLVEGPIAGTPFVAGTSFDLAEVGYMQEEYFISGTASAFVNVDELGEDGHWTAEPGVTADYKTRILVYRPIDASAFSGSVFVEWLNVGFLLSADAALIKAAAESSDFGA